MRNTDLNLLNIHTLIDETIIEHLLHFLMYTATTNTICNFAFDQYSCPNVGIIIFATVQKRPGEITNLWILLFHLQYIIYRFCNIVFDIKKFQARRPIFNSYSAEVITFFIASASSAVDAKIFSGLLLRYFVIVSEKYSLVYCQ